MLKVTASINIPTRHSCSLCGTKTTFLHLLRTSSKVRSSMQSTVTLVVDQALVKVMICVFVTILKLVNHTAILVTLINFLHSYVQGSEQAENLLAGQQQFKTTEIEVFN